MKVEEVAIYSSWTMPGNFPSMPGPSWAAHAMHWDRFASASISGTKIFSVLYFKMVRPETALCCCCDIFPGIFLVIPYRMIFCFSLILPDISFITYESYNGMIFLVIPRSLIFLAVSSACSSRTDVSWSNIFLQRHNRLAAKKGRR